MNFVLNANVPYSSLEIFKELDLKAVHVREIGLGSAEDEEIPSYAKRKRAIVVIRDLNFGTLVVFSHAREDVPYFNSSCKIYGEMPFIAGYAPSGTSISSLGYLPHNPQDIGQAALFLSAV